MKTSTLTSLISSLSIMSLSLLLIVSFSVEVSAKRGCTNFGHSCLGGHGKRSNSDVAVNAVNPVNLERNEYQPTRDIGKCRRCAMEVLSRRAREEKNYIPLLITQMLASYRRPYNADLTPNDE